MKKLLISLLLLLIATAVVQAAIPTPPLADDSSLVLRFSFDNVDFSSFENSLDGWTVGGTGSYSYDFVSSWTTHGSYSLKLTTDVAGNNVQSVYIEKTLSFTANVITFDYKLVDNPDGGEKLIVYCDGTEAWNTTAAESGSAYVKCSGTTIKIELGAGVAGLATAYIDNVRVFNAEDDSGNGNDGTVYGATSVEGRYGWALSFGGEGNYVEVPHSDTFNTSVFTIALWLNASEGYGSGTNPGIIAKRESTSQISWGLWIEQATGYIWGRVLQSDGTQVNLPKNYIIQPNKWYFIVFIADGSNIKLYVNNEFVSSASYDGTVYNTTAPIYIARQLNEYFNGIIDEVRIYNRSLSDSEIQQMYEALRVKFYDESSGEKIAANATIFNANHSVALTTDEVTKEAVLFNADLPAPGNYILQASSSNYYTRNFFVNLSGSYQEKEYLLLSKSADAVLINFKLNDPTGTFQKPVLVIEKSEVQEGEVTSDYFDVEQKVPTILMFNSRYFITVIDAESSTERKIGEFVASSSGDKYINVYSNIVPHSPLLDFTYDIYDANDSIVVQYNDTAKQTEYINVKIYNSTGYLVYNDTAAANDYALTYIKPNLNETYKVELHIKRVDQEILETDHVNHVSKCRIISTEQRLTRS